MPQVFVIDYGMGNILSVLSAVRFLGATAEVTSDPESVARAAKLILPGVGSFRRAMESLRASGLDRAIHHAVHNDAKLLGICLGMQLLGTVGTEDGETEGLGLVNQRVDAFSPGELAGRKVPHIGFSPVKAAPGARLFAGLPAEADFYFVHSYRMAPDIPDTVVSSCEHGVPFAAAVEKGNIFGTQFHPEKSQTNGLLLLRNFLRL
jgi:imidazole glycerol phosphate synthase, glutamine amidotransferase subunit